MEYVGQHDKMDITDRVQQHERDDEDQPWGPIIGAKAMYRWEVIHRATPPDREVDGTLVWWLIVLIFAFSFGHS